jgi:acetyl esterase
VSRPPGRATRSFSCPGSAHAASPVSTLASRSTLHPMAIKLASVTEATQHGIARLIDALPAGAAARIGGGSRDADGQVLDPHLALVLAFEERFGGRRADASVTEMRAATRASARIAAGAPIPVGPVRDLLIDGAEGSLPARHYAPSSGGIGRPLLVFFHGGGWVVGDLDTHDQPCRFLTRYADVHVLSVDYRLAPEHPFPAAVDDAVAAFAWAVARALELGADPARVAVGGDSAGGNLAAVVAQHTRDAGVATPAAQLLVYPGTDSSVARPSKDLFAEGYFLTKQQMDWYWDTYSAGASRTDPRLSPLCASDLSGLAPAVVATAAFDPLRDEGEAYAAALRAAGVPVALRRAPGLVHGYLNMTGVHRASFAESLAVSGAFAALLETAAR